MLKFFEQQRQKKVDAAIREAVQWGKWDEAMHYAAHGSPPAETLDYLVESLIKAQQWLDAKRAVRLGASGAMTNRFIDACIANHELAILLDFADRSAPEELRERIVRACVEEGQVDTAKKLARSRPTRHLTPAEISRLVDVNIEAGLVNEALKAIATGGEERDFEALVEAALANGRDDQAAAIAKRGVSAACLERLIHRLVERGSAKAALEAAKLRVRDGRGKLSAEELNHLAESRLAKGSSLFDLWPALQIAEEAVSPDLRERIVGLALDLWGSGQLPSKEEMLEKEIPVTWYEEIFEVAKQGLSPALAERLIPFCLEHSRVDEAFETANRRQADGKGGLTSKELATLRSIFLTKHYRGDESEIREPSNHPELLNRVIHWEIRREFPDTEVIRVAVRLRKPDGSGLLTPEEENTVYQRYAMATGDSGWTARRARAVLTQDFIDRTGLAHLGRVNYENHTERRADFESALKTFQIGASPAALEQAITYCIENRLIKETVELAKLRDPEKGISQGEIDRLVVSLHQGGLLPEAVQAARLGASPAAVDRLVLRYLNPAEIKESLSIARIGASPEAAEMLVSFSVRHGMVPEAVEAAKLRAKDGTGALAAGEIDRLVQGAMKERNTAKALTAAKLRGPEGQGKLKMEEVDQLARGLLEDGRLDDALEIARLGATEPVASQLVAAAVRRNLPRVAEAAAKLRKPDGTGSLTDEEYKALSRT